MELELKKHKGIIDGGLAHGHMEVANLADDPRTKIIHGELGANKKLKRGIHNAHEL